MRLLDPKNTFRGTIEGVPYEARWVSAGQALRALDAEADGANWIEQRRAIAAHLAPLLVSLGDMRAPTADHVLDTLTLDGVASLFYAVVFAKADAGKSDTP